MGLMTTVPCGSISAAVYVEAQSTDSFVTTKRTEYIRCQHYFVSNINQLRGERTEVSFPEYITHSHYNLWIKLISAPFSPSIPSPIQFPSCSIVFA